MEIELLNLVGNVKSQYSATCVEDLVEQKEFTVYRIPPYCCELNPIELVWSDVKRHVARDNKTFKTNVMEGLIIDTLNSVTEQKWRNYCKHGGRY